MKIILVTLALVAASHAAVLGRQPLVGGVSSTTLNESSPSVIFAIKSINNYYGLQGDNSPRTLVKVVKAETQVVAGSLDHMVLEVISGKTHEMCELKVWSRPWLTDGSANQVTEGPACKPFLDSNAATPMIGAPIAIDLDRTDVQNAIAFGMKAFNSQSNDLYMRKATSVTKVTSQVVSGMSYHFSGVEMSATTCTKSSNTLLKDCQVAADADVFTCSFTIWWQSWMTPEYQLNDLKCN